jgi:hypothetical protein
VKREELEHVLRAASRIVNQRDFLVVGSAAILATYDDDALPHEASRSDEADLAPFDDPDGKKSLLVEGALGQGSRFHDTFGYYADGVDFRTAVAPDGWQDRLVVFDPPGAEPGRGLCLDSHDLAASKLAAGRSKDYEFVGALLDVGLIDREVLTGRVAQLPRDRVSPGLLRRATTWLASRTP